jgi:hypothetical protein
MASQTAIAPDSVAVNTGPSRLECDLVMKGGITSGVIYPRLVSELSFRQHGDSEGHAGRLTQARDSFRDHHRLDLKSLLALRRIHLHRSSSAKLGVGQRQPRPVLQIPGSFRRFALTEEGRCSDGITPNLSH